MSDLSPEMTHQIEAVPNKSHAKILDLKITDLASGEERVLPNTGGYDLALFFEHALGEILGREDAATGIYCKAERPKVTRAAMERIRSAYASSLDH